MVYRVPHRVSEKAVVRGPGGMPLPLITPRYLAGTRVSESLGAVAAAAGGFYQDLLNLGLDTGVDCVLDAGDSDSYSGSGQTWDDLSGGSPSHFSFGADTSAASDDPTFNGVAGDLSSAEYMSTDGGDHFEYNASLESWMTGLGKDNAEYSMAFWVHIPSGGIASNMIIMSAGIGDGSGIKTGILSTVQDRPNIEVRKAPGNAGVFTMSTAANANAWNFIAWTIDEGGGTVSLGYLNGSLDSTFDAAYSGPSALDSTTFRLLEAGGAGEAAQSGFRLAGIMVWEGVKLTEGNWDSIFDAQKGRFGL